MARVIIMGATTGIGRALAVEMSRRGHAIGATGRRADLLATLDGECPGPVVTRVMDVTLHAAATDALDALIAEMGGLDILIIAAGVGVKNPAMAMEPDLHTIAVNVAGFSAMATAGYRYFARQGHGHLVGISSIAGLRGGRHNPAYGASKAFEISYLEGLRWRARHDGIRLAVTDIRPGFIDTPMTRGQQGMFWVAPADVAARQIADAIARRRRVAYITHRWAIMAWLYRHLPAWLLERA